MKRANSNLGGGISETIVHVRRWAPIQWCVNSMANLGSWDPWEWYPESFEPSSFTHLAKSHVNPKASEMIEDLFMMDDSDGRKTGSHFDMN